MALSPTAFLLTCEEKYPETTTDELAPSGDISGGRSTAIRLASDDRQVPVMQLDATTVSPIMYSLFNQFAVISDNASNQTRSISRLGDRGLMSPVVVDERRAISPNLISLGPDILAHPEQYLWMLEDSGMMWELNKPIGLATAGHLIMVAAITKNDPALLRRVLEQRGAIGYLFDALMVANAFSLDSSGSPTRTPSPSANFLKRGLELLANTDVSPEMIVEMIRLAILKRCPKLIPIIAGHPNTMRVPPQEIGGVLDFVASRGDWHSAYLLLNQFGTVIPAENMVRALSYAFVSADIATARSLLGKCIVAHVAPEVLGQLLVVAVKLSKEPLVEQILANPAAEALSHQYLFEAGWHALVTEQNEVLRRILILLSEDEFENPVFVGMGLVHGFRVGNMRTVCEAIVDPHYGQIPTELVIIALESAIKSKNKDLVTVLAAHEQLRTLPAKRWEDLFKLAARVADASVVAEVWRLLNLASTAPQVSQEAIYAAIDSGNSDTLAMLFSLIAPANLPSLVKDAIVRAGNNNNIAIAMTILRLPCDADALAKRWVVTLLLFAKNENLPAVKSLLANLPDPDYIDVDCLALALRLCIAKGDREAATALLGHPSARNFGLEYVLLILKSAIDMDMIDIAEEMCDRVVLEECKPAELEVPITMATEHRQNSVVRKLTFLRNLTRESEEGTLPRSLAP